jgi:hypothetical protein
MQDFPSKLNPQHAFNVAATDRIGDGSWIYSDKIISPRVVWADCMGDAPTRHTPYAPLISERLEEFLYTLACYLAEHGCNADIASMWPRDLEPSRINRFANITYNERKPTYYNMYGETSTAKRHATENNWSKVPEWATGNNDAAKIYSLQMAFIPIANSLHALHFLREATKITGIHYTIPEQFLPYGLKDKGPSLASLLSICQGYIDAYKALERTKQDMESWEHVYLKEMAQPVWGAHG